MKRLLAACSVTLLGSAPLGAQNQSRDIVATALAAGSFNTLAKALQAADLVDALRGKGPFTVFAPTDAAFAKLPEATLQALLQPENRGSLTAILKFHVLGQRLASKQVDAQRGALTLNGSALRFGRDGAALTVSGARVTQGDLVCSNGVIHVVDSVLLPPDQDLAGVAKAAGKFETLLVAAKAAGLLQAAAGRGDFTVLAPTDEAFAKIPQRTLKSLLQPENRDRLRAILSLHVIPGRVFAADAVQARDARAMGGAVRFEIVDGALRANGARVVATDLQAKNGVVHAIDTVLLPEEPQGRKVVGLYLEAPGEALAEQLGVSTESALLVTGVVDGGNAAAAGLRRFDVIVQVDGTPATRANFERAKDGKPVGEALQLQVRRRGETVTVAVPVGVERG
jgi:transforming growth factor-beta-induced protein